MTMLEVDPTQKTKLVARFKKLRLAHFPPGVNVKLGRFAYDLDATMRVMLVFVLMDSLVLPAQAISLLNDHWAAIRHQIDEVAAALVMRDGVLQNTSPHEDAVSMVISTGTLDHWAKSVSEDVRLEKSNRAAKPGELELLTQRQMEERARTKPVGRIPPARLVVDLGLIASWTMRTIVERGWSSPEQLGIPAR